MKFRFFLRYSKFCFHHPTNSNWKMIVLRLEQKESVRCSPVSLSNRWETTKKTRQSMGPLLLLMPMWRCSTTNLSEDFQRLAFHLWCQGLDLNKKKEKDFENKQKTCRDKPMRFWALINVFVASCFNLLGSRLNQPDMFFFSFFLIRPISLSFYIWFSMII